MEYSIIEGHRTGSRLVYVHKEKFLYMKKNERGGKRTYICYQKVLSGRERIGEDHTKCSACVIIDKNEICWRNSIHHTNHQNHRTIYNDLCSLKVMKNACEFIRDNLTISAAKISTQEIFHSEITK